LILNPDLAAAVAALAEQRLGDVLEPLQRAAALESGDAGHWQGVVNVAARIGDDDLALAAATRLRALAPRDSNRRAIEMQLRGETGAIREALSLARKLESDHPSDARWPLVAGTHLARLGRHEDALRSLHRAVRLAPNSALAWESLASLKTFSPGDPDLAALEQAVAAAGERPEAAALAYALAKACDDVGDVDRAYAWFQRGAARTLEGRMPRMDAFFTQAAEARAAFPLERLSADRASTRPERPILIIGCPRSGTTLLERILATSPEIASGGELKMLRLACLGFSPPSPARVDSYVQQSGGEAQAWQRVAETYVRKLVHRFGRADGVVDKGLVNYLYVGALAVALPQARIIHVRRDPIDVAWSCFRRRFHDGLAWSYHFDSLAAFIRVYGDMAAHWQQVLPGRILTVEFEKLVTDPESETARVFEFVGIERPADWQSFHQQAGAVHTSSHLQVRRPLNADGIGAWKRYERHLGPLRDALAKYGALPPAGPASSTHGT
jgi:predicted Zn-dependent protease